MTTTTRRVTFPEPYAIRVEEAELPPLGPRDALIRSTAVGICGSDLHAFAGKHRFIPLPCHPGHEVAGVVEAVGDGVAGFTAGDRVLVEPGLVCGTCERCREGRYNICDHLQVFGCQTPGAMADRFVIDAGRLHAIPDGMSDAEAALVEPLSTATHAVRIAGGDLTGKRVAVLGAGTIGLLTMLAARAAGAERVVVTDLLGHKRDRALRLGADAALDGAGDAVSEIRRLFGGRADVVFDCVTNQASTDQAVALADKGGMIVVEGIATVNVTLDLLLVQDRELRIEGALMYTREDVVLAIDLMARGVVPVEELVTATFDLDDAPAAFDAARSGDHVKVHIVL